MKENGNKSEINLCHACRWGGEIVEQCNCPKLTDRRIITPTQRHTGLLKGVEVIARSKGIEDFNPLSFVAVTAAATNGKCYYYQPTN